MALADDGAHYAIKLFKQKDANQRCYTGAEAYAHYVAKQLDLSVPDAVLIELPKNLLKLVERVSPDKYADILGRDYERPAFATKYLSNLLTYSPALSKKYNECGDIETIFAFDTLILNEDRKFRKPNILRSRHNYFLIDHEKSFEGIPYSQSLFNIGTLCPYSKYHLFFKILKKKAKKEGTKKLFENFEYLFSIASLNGLKDIRHQLNSLNYNTDECELWENYLKEKKQNLSKFITTLKSSLK